MARKSLRQWFFRIATSVLFIAMLVGLLHLDWCVQLCSVAMTMLQIVCSFLFSKFMCRIFFGGLAAWTLVLPLALTWLDKMLGRLLGWAMLKTPKALSWTVERVRVRPCLPWSRDAWSEIVLVNWTWHNPPSFDAKDYKKNYLLQIDCLTLRVEFASILRALWNRQSHAIQIDLLMMEGVRFRMLRNEHAALNLWEALQQPDQDVNINTIIDHARAHGGYHDSVVLKSLPAVATEATRAAANFREEWKKKWTGELLRRAEAYTPERCHPLLPCPRRNPLHRSISSMNSGQISIKPPVNYAYFEFPPGDPRRRPRWGVPVRFNIKHAVVFKVSLYLFDLLTTDRHDYTLKDHKVKVGSLSVLREELETGDERRIGEGLLGDGVRGIYLGELVWVLIASILPKVALNYPSQLLRTGVTACSYRVQDACVNGAAQLQDWVFDAKRLLMRQKELACPLDGRHVFVHLRSGRMAYKGTRANVQATLLLWACTRHDDGMYEAESAIRHETKTPRWDEHFHLGPIAPVECSEAMLRITFWHHAAIKVNLGEVNIPVSGIEETASGKRVVGHFHLSLQCGGLLKPSFGRVKLGLNLRAENSRTSR